MMIFLFNVAKISTSLKLVLINPMVIEIIEKFSEKMSFKTTPEHGKVLLLYCSLFHTEINDFSSNMHTGPNFPLL